MNLEAAVKHWKLSIGQSWTLVLIMVFNWRERPSSKHKKEKYKTYNIKLVSHMKKYMFSNIYAKKTETISSSM